MSWVSGRSLVFTMMAALDLCFLAGSSMAADCSVQTTDFTTSFGNTFNISPSGFTNSEIQTASGELFGDATLLADSTRAANGYLALAELDMWLFGGNEDGQIDAGDIAFGSLLLWTDRDHSGTSRPDELQTLDQAGIRRIGLEHGTSHRRDRYGNELRFLGRAWQERRPGVVSPIQTWDVFFMVTAAR